MNRPEDIIETGKYKEKENESVLFYSLLEWQAYALELEKKLKQ